MKWKSYELEEFQQAWDEPIEHLTLSESFIDDVMDQLPEIQVNPSIQPKRSICFMHYVFATAATFTLLFTGVFDQVPSFINHYSSDVMEVTFHLNQASEQSMDWVNHMDFNISDLIDIDTWKK